MDALLKRVLKKASPTKSQERELDRISRLVLSATNAVATKFGCESMLAGSVTRNTWLPDKKEVDVFVLFPENTPREILEKEGVEIGKRVVSRLGGKSIISYAEHPYVHGKIGNYEIDVVPCYKIKSAEKIKSAVDRTPFHVRYIERNLLPEKAGEVRLLKQFFKGLGVYGADLKTEGFSGYLCDLLIIKHGSFREFIKSASKWGAKEIISVTGEKISSSVLKNFKRHPLVVIDPVDSDRNVAAALTPKNYVKFTEAARSFIRKPSEDYFFPKKIPMNAAQFKKLLDWKGTKIISIAFKPPKVIPDILWPQLRKAADMVEKILRENEFIVLNKGVWSDGNKTALIIFEMETALLPETQKRIGPSTLLQKNSNNFREHYKDAMKLYVEGDRWVAEIKRKFRTPEGKLMESLRRDVKALQEKGIPGYIADSMQKSFRLLMDENVYEHCRKLKIGKELGIFLKEFFQR